ncbi:MAG: flagellar basal body P-ring formation protein FlgA [bacterium]|nr:flagellar basal body P-ring formation protein FlgA [bacterium]
MTPRGIRLLILLLAALAAPAAARAWVLELRESWSTDGALVRLGDVAAGEVPAAAAALVLAADGTPGGTLTLDRGAVLRRLVTERLAADVVCRGPASCVVTFAATRLDPARIETALRAALAAWVPPSAPDGPPTTLEIAGDLPSPALDGAWSLSLIDPRPLLAGRNLVRARLEAGRGAARFTATVVCHLHGEIARARSDLQPGQPLDGDQLSWEWCDLAGLRGGELVGRAAAAGMTCAAPVPAGAVLRQAAVRRTPLITAGQRVELVLDRGGVSVTTMAVAREDGAGGEQISVRNELDGRLVRARVEGPGRVAWNR